MDTVLNKTYHDGVSRSVRSERDPKTYIELSSTLFAKFSKFWTNQTELWTPCVIKLLTIFHKLMINLVPPELGAG
jgi:hypothetical protein